MGGMIPRRRKTGLSGNHLSGIIPSKEKNGVERESFEWNDSLEGGKWG